MVRREASKGSFKGVLRRGASEAEHLRVALKGGFRGRRQRGALKEASEEVFFKGGFGEGFQREGFKGRLRRAAGKQDPKGVLHGGASKEEATLHTL